MRRISVIGFGKIGQAIAANILQHGIAVTAVDTNTQLLQSFAQGSYITNEPGLEEILTTQYKEGNLEITGEFSRIKGSEAFILAIPLLVDQEKKILDAPFADCLRALSPYCSGKMVIIIETTMPVGYGRNTVVAVLESAGSRHGRDFLLAHSPERIKSGTMLQQLSEIPKVIGGVTEEAADKAYSIYESFFNRGLLKKVESIEAAEMVKLAGMIYRDVNIALANQLAQFANATGIHYADLIPLINTDREANLLQPGIGVGGHCTPVYPYFLIDNFKQADLDFSLARQCRDINDGMAGYAVSMVKDKVIHKKALLLGLGFRPNVKEDALSTAYLLKDELAASGFSVSIHDTEFSSEEIAGKGFRVATDIYTANAEVVFLVTMHKEYTSLDFERLASQGVRYFVDGRNSVDPAKVKAAGIQYFGIGR